jgi:hypothetical protein
MQATSAWRVCALLLTRVIESSLFPMLLCFRMMPVIHFIWVAVELVTICLQVVDCMTGRGKGHRGE